MKNFHKSYKTINAYIKGIEDRKTYLEVYNETFKNLTGDKILTPSEEEEIKQKVKKLHPEPKNPFSFSSPLFDDWNNGYLEEKYGF